MGEVKYDIAELMREYGNDILRTAYAYVKDKDTAEDIFQETFIKAYRNLDKFNGESSIKTWLIRIAINTSKDYLKSAYNRNVVSVDEFDENAAVSTDDYTAVENADTYAQVRAAVDSLPENYREVVMLVYFKELSVNEAADSIGVPPGTIKSRLSRARDILKTKLEGRVSL